DWDHFVNNTKLINQLRAPNGSWENYLKGAYLRLLNKFQTQIIYGANLCVKGNIPIASGLSSSSALTVGALKTISYLNNLNLSEDTLINLCAEAEWFVGTRGGAADHAAIVLAKKNKVLHVKFFEFEVISQVSFPMFFDLLVCDTNIVADKSGSKKDEYNQKVLAYELGFKFIKKILPSASNNLRYLRDVSPDNLKLPLKDLLRYLNEVPEYILFQELSDYFGDEASQIIEKYNFISPPSKIHLRKILLYGISECQRSKLFIEALKHKNFKQIGTLMKLSHDGDRKFIFDSDDKLRYYNNNISNKLLRENSEKSLYQFSGGYGCSIKEIDFIVDKALNVPGVIGAQLSGAGYGGCAMIIVRKNFTEQLISELKKKYYNFFNSKLKIYNITPVNGASIYNLG
ncbi:MAG: hypothetical protein GF353_24645, partial [Candidatus Lokiarchaeota archaeon]|nr:hypothetical protein [Candidatus Lokiarchaeota archaeon]